MKRSAPSNISAMFSTFETSHEFSGWLKRKAQWNISLMSLTFETFHDASG